MAFLCHVWDNRDEEKFSLLDRNLKLCICTCTMVEIKTFSCMHMLPTSSFRFPPPPIIHSQSAHGQVYLPNISACMWYSYTPKGVHCITPNRFILNFKLSLNKIVWQISTKCAVCIQLCWWISKTSKNTDCLKLQWFCKTKLANNLIENKTLNLVILTKIRHGVNWFTSSDTLCILRIRNKKNKNVILTDRLRVCLLHQLL